MPTRAHVQPPQVGVDARKRSRLARLACRFDVVAVTLDAAGGPPRVEHFPGAFAAGGWTG